MTVIGNQQFLWNQKINYHKHGTRFISFTNPYCFISIGYNRCLTIFKMRSLYSSTVLKQTHSMVDISLFYTSHQSVKTQVHQLLWSDEIYVIVFRRSVRYSFSHQIHSWLWRHKYPLTECSFSLLLLLFLGKQKLFIIVITWTKKCEEKRDYTNYQVFLLCKMLMKFWVQYLPTQQGYARVPTF